MKFKKVPGPEKSRGSLRAYSSLLRTLERKQHASSSHDQKPRQTQITMVTVMKTIKDQLKIQSYILVKLWFMMYVNTRQFKDIKILPRWINTWILDTGFSNQIAASSLNISPPVLIAFNIRVHCFNSSMNLV